MSERGSHPAHRAAEELLECARRDPDTTLRRVNALMSHAGRDSALRITLRHAGALAKVERGQVGVAAGELRRLINRAERTGHTELIARLRLTLAWIELDRGRPGASRHQLDAAQPHLRGVHAARARCLRGLQLCASGQHSDALAQLAAAERGLRRHNDRHWLANLLVGRGTARGYLLRVRDAATDFTSAAGLFTELGEPERAAACLHNLGFVAALAGDLPRALHCFAAAEHSGLRLDRRPEGLLDIANALLAAGLLTDARHVLARAARLLADTGRGTKLAEATFLVAQCALSAGDPVLASATAARARQLFRAQQRSAWHSAATAIELAARLADDPVAVSAAVVARVAARCDRHGWPMLAAGLRLGIGGPARLAEVAAHRRHGQAQLRVMGWLAHARLAADRGDRRAVLAACRAGLRITDASVTGELPHSCGAIAAQLAQLGLATALRSGRPRVVLRWTDRHRAVTLHRPSPHPPDNQRQADALVRLRAQLAMADGSVEHQRKIVALENTVRQCGLAESPRAFTPDPLSENELVAALGNTALISFALDNGVLVAVSVVDGRFRLHRLGCETAMRTALGSLRLAATVEEESAARRSADEVDELLFGPLVSLFEDRPVVVVPTGVLHHLPWAALPSCLGRPLCVAPSVASWLTAATRKTKTSAKRRVWAAGPGLRHAEHEVTALGSRHDGQVFTGSSSAVADVLSAMDGADLAHIAAHGRFRSDAPLFSCLELADGPLYGYDLQRLAAPPRRIVLSACDSGRATVRADQELIGMVAALLRGGTSTVIASVLPVPDDRVVPLMVALHDGLHRGQPPSVALANAQARHGDLGFVCFGAG